jgi:hypothetical protein
MTDGLDGITYELGDGAPDNATLDADSGEFYWLPPADQGSGRISVQLLAKRDAKVEAECIVFIDVRAAAVKAEIIEFENEMITAGQLWTRKLSLFGLNNESAKVEYKLIGNPPDGLSLDATTGEFSWTPTNQQAGRQPINVRLIDPTNDRLVDSATCSVVVLPAPVEPVLTLKTQTIEAGKTLDVMLPEISTTRVPPRAVWELIDPQPGTRVGRRSGRFEWQVPATAKGTTTFRFTVSRLRRSEQVTLKVTVTAASSTESSATTMPLGSKPDASKIATAEAEVKELFKREFAQKGMTASRELAMKLLVQSRDEQSSAMRYALLKLGFEQASEGRAYATGCEIADEMSRSYAADSIEQTVALLDGFRSRYATDRDKAILGEVVFREALNATQAGRFKSAAALIKAADLIAKGSSYADVVDEAAARLKSLPTDSDVPDLLDEKQQLAKRELTTLLERFQFKRVFFDGNSLRFLQTDGSDPTVSRSLWTISEREILMEAPQSELETGFVDPSLNSSSYVLRMQVASDSTAGAVLLGSPGSGRVYGYLIPLAGIDRLHVKQTNLNQSLAQPKGRMTPDKSGWDLVEIVVTEKSIGVSLNGNRIANAVVEEPPQGSVGVVAVLKQATGEHRLRIRDARFMEIAN